MRLVELHVLQSFPIACLNVDMSTCRHVDVSTCRRVDTSTPKTSHDNTETPTLTYFGGVLRAKIRGCYWKRATQVFMKELTKHVNTILINNVIFGRTVPTTPDHTTESAAIFGPAVSTHKAIEVDYFAAVDATPETLEPDSACFYRYIGLNWNLFTEYLEPSETQPPNDILRMFLRSAICAAPGAKTVPGYVLGLARNGTPLSLLDAFETPVLSRHNYLEPSYETMKKHFKLLKQVYKELYADKTRTEAWFSTTPEECPPVSLDDFIGQLVDGVAYHIRSTHTLAPHVRHD